MTPVQDVWEMMKISIQHLIQSMWCEYKRTIEWRFAHINSWLINEKHTNKSLNWEKRMSKSEEINICLKQLPFLHLKHMYLIFSILKQSIFSKISTMYLSTCGFQDHHSLTEFKRNRQTIMCFNFCKKKSNTDWQVLEIQHFFHYLVQFYISTYIIIFGALNKLEYGNLYNETEY